jgi:gliding motility-associated-like protein
VSDVNTPNANCANAYSRVRTWNFTDGCGNTSANFVQTITITDTTAPTWTTETGSLNTTVECSDAQALANAQNLFPIATDNCDTNLSNIVKVAGPFVASETCANAGTYTNTWTVKDDCGNTSEIFTQTITTQDTTAPTFIAPADITLSSGTNCYADISTTTTGDVTRIQDNCDPNPTTSFIDSDCFGNFNSASVNSGTGNYFPFTVSGFGNVSANAIKKVALAFETNQGKGRAEFILVAPNGQGIVLVAPYCNGGDCDNPTHNEKELYLPEFYPNSSNYPKWDNNNPIVTNSVQNFTPNGDLSTTNTVNGLNTLVSSFEEFTGNVNGNWFIFARKDGTENGRIEFKSVCLTPGSNLCGNNKVIIRKWSVSDACSNTVAFNQIITITDTTAPTWTTETGSLNTSVECSDTQALANAQNLFPIATDNCDTNLSNIVKVAGPFVASETCANAGTYTNTWTVTDDCGNTSETFIQVINVIDTTVPTWTTETGSLNTSVECSDTQALANVQNLFPIATDNCDTNLSNIVKVAGPFVASETCANAGTYTNTWTVTDDCGNTSETFIQVINVMDTTVPTWTTETGSLNTSVECSDTQALANAQNLFPIATDNCDTNLSNIVKVAGPFVASETCANAGTYTNKWTVTDDCGNTSETFIQVINVMDTTVPTWTTETGSLNTSVECSDAQALANAQNLFPIATDNCDTNLSNIVKVAGPFVASETCANAGTYTNTWTVTDDCGNTSEMFTQVINVMDTTVPTWTTETGSLNTTVECSDAQALANAQNLFPIATDNCDTNLSNIVKVAGPFVASETCANAGTYTNTWTVTDDCGNTSETFTQVITIQDKTAPKIITEASDRTIECDGECDNNEIVNWLANNGGAIASDNCSEVTWTNNFDTIVYNCYTSITVTFTATDACGNTASTSAKFTAQDTTPPVVPEVLTDITVECTSNLPVILTPASNNNGFNNVTIEEVNSIELGKCENSYTLFRTLNFKDTCDNISSVSQTVHVVDNTPPTIASLPETKTITCPDVPVFEQAIATDGCSNSSLTFNDVKTEGNCPGFYSITRTWRAIDSCGNSTTASQTINVEDRTGPITTTEFNPTINVNCDAIPARPELVFTDGCSTINPAVFTEIISNQTTDSYVINRKWSVSDTCGNTSEFVQTVNVTIANSLITLTGSVCNDGDTTSIDLTSLFPNGTPTTGTWTDVSNTGKLEGNNFNATNLAVGDYIFEYTINDPNCPRSIRITVTVTTGCGGIVLPCGTIVVHNAFSPNGDGINEKFVIDNINDTNCYPDNTVEIYNRWGVLVYSTKGYNNTTNAFDGISIGQSGISQSSGLPAGTYFYILNYTSFDNDNTIQNNKKVGYLFLTK